MNSLFESHKFWCDICSITKIDNKDRIINQYFSTDQTSKFKRHLMTKTHQKRCIEIDKSEDKVECPICNRVMSKEAFILHEKRNELIFAMMHPESGYLYSDMNEEDRIKHPILKNKNRFDAAPGKYIEEIEEAINSGDLSCNNFKIGNARYSSPIKWLQAVKRHKIAQRNRR